MGWLTTQGLGTVRSKASPRHGLAFMVFEAASHTCGFAIARFHGLFGRSSVALAILLLRRLILTL